MTAPATTSGGPGEDQERPAASGNRTDPGPGPSFGPYPRRWTRRDSIIYALGVGAGTDELSLTTDTTRAHPQQAIPTFAINQGLGGRGFDLSVIGDPRRMVHAQHRLVLHAPVTPAGQVETRGRVAESVRKRSGRMVTVEWESTEPDSGRLLFTNIVTYLVREPDDGTPSGSGRYELGAAVPEGPPQQVVTDRTLPTQALLYRCSGDPNVIHTDPDAARSAGFRGPILQGLCTLGFAARALLHTVCAEDPARFAALDCRFSSPGYPGDTLSTSIWTRSDGAVSFRTTNQEGAVLLDRGLLRLTDGVG